MDGDVRRRVVVAAGVELKTTCVVPPPGSGPAQRHYREAVRRNPNGRWSRQSIYPLPLLNHGVSICLHVVNVPVLLQNRVDTRRFILSLRSLLSAR